MVRKGTLRRDLLYRISSFTMTVPPLRDRINDARELVVHYLHRLCGEYGVAVRCSERILLVDDEAPLVDIGRKMLKHLGYQVVGCTSSLEALDLFTADPTGFDLVITDQTMPGMVGLNLAHKVAEINPNVPVILCTGFSGNITPESTKMAGIKGLAMKPMLTGDISDLVRSVLDNQDMSLKQPDFYGPLHPLP
jgi:DNA-binding NtrC family response regulator